MADILEAIGLASQATAWQAVLLTAISFGVGVLGGFVGLALGTMRLPALLLLGFPAPVAAGTNILVSALSALTGSIRHVRERRVDWRVVGVMGIPAVIGSFLGGFLSGRVNEELLIALAGVFVVWQGVELTRRGWRERTAPEQRVGEARQERFTPGRMTAETGIGLGVGLLGGAVGLILGSIRLPAMVRILGIDPRVAAGTNLVIGLLMGAAGFVGHGVQGEVDGLLLVLMGISGMIGTWYGARLTGRVRLSTLILVMGLVLLVVGLLLLGDAYLRTS
ncbi:MAG: sulfite exporter TauE/SafE family protein [Chloroflexi bacterium]|nr:sulfite exporter TauE/SafE family protein [Chloroflexota bacterium]